jgi:hypothetical protein
MSSSLLRFGQVGHSHENPSLGGWGTRWSVLRSHDTWLLSERLSFRARAARRSLNSPEIRKCIVVMSWLANRPSLFSVYLQFSR